MSNFIKKQAPSRSPFTKSHGDFLGSTPDRSRVRLERHSKVPPSAPSYWKNYQQSHDLDDHSMPDLDSHKRKYIAPFGENGPQLRVKERASNRNVNSRSQKRSVEQCPQHCQGGQREIQRRFNKIEEIFEQQNQNLKEQKDYLLQVIEKMKAREKDYKAQLKAYKESVKELTCQNTLLRDKYEQARDFIANGIGKIEEAFTLERQHSGARIPKANNTHTDTASSINVSDTIDELGDKFDALMFEYQKTKNPTLRKECMELAKQIRQLKKGNPRSQLYGTQ